MKTLLQNLAENFSTTKFGAIATVYVLLLSTVILIVARDQHQET